MGVERWGCKDDHQKRKATSCAPRLPFPLEFGNSLLSFPKLPRDILLTSFDDLTEDVSMPEVQVSLPSPISLPHLLSTTSFHTSLPHLLIPVVQVSLPSFALGLPAYYVLALSEASSNLSRYTMGSGACVLMAFDSDHILLTKCMA